MLAFRLEGPNHTDGTTPDIEVEAGDERSSQGIGTTNPELDITRQRPAPIGGEEGVCA